jgi:hypothetical protein
LLFFFDLPRPASTCIHAHLSLSGVNYAAQIR